MIKKSKEIQNTHINVFKNLIHNMFEINERSSNKNYKIYDSGFDIQKALNAMKIEDGRDPNPFYFQRLEL